MRQKFIPIVETNKARRSAPAWACKVAKTEGGHIAFESGTEYNRWRRENAGWGCPPRKEAHHKKDSSTI